jgi:integrase
MATYRKRSGSWEALVVRKVGEQIVRRSGSFSTKAEAQAWAAKIETEIADGKAGKLPDRPFRDLLIRYRDEVAPTKRGAGKEIIRINALLKDDLADIRLASLRAADFAAWRDRRLKLVSAGSVLREWTQLSAICVRAWKEWHWLAGNPLSDVKRPDKPVARDRRVSDDELDRLGYALGTDYSTQTGRVHLAMLFAVETAMRAGEIVALQWADVHLDRRFLTVRQGKTQAASRDVPLSVEAVRLIGLLPQDGGPVFGLESANMDALFRKAKARSLIDDLHFHDLRHEAITRLAKKLDVLALARMVGHRDLRMLQIYYNPSATELAGRLD